MTRPIVDVLSTPNLGDRSYVVHADGSAVVVDPQRDIDRVLATAAERGSTVTHVLETHLHNDYVSGGLQLARETGAEYVVPADAIVAYERTPAAEGTVFAWGTTGALRWRAIATPGHTPHHLSYVLEPAEPADAPAAAAGPAGGGRPALPTCVFTGGSVLFGSVGRTDLIGPDFTEPLARAQWASVRRTLSDLPPDAEVYPTHGFGSFCSALPTSGDAATVAGERLANPAMRQDEEEFVRSLLSGLDDYPAYYAHMGPANASGPAAVDLSPPRRAAAREVLERIDAGEWVIDLRRRRMFAAGHVPRTLSFDAAGNVPTYLGWLIPWGTPITVLGESAEQVAAVQRELVRIGIDRIEAAVGDGPGAWVGDRPLDSFPVTDFAGLATAQRSAAPPQVLDVRRRAEWERSHISGAHHVPLHELEIAAPHLPPGPLWVHCGSGFRAAVAASLLRRHDVDVVLVDDDFSLAGPAGVGMAAEA